MVTEHVNDKETLGSFIYHLCNGKDTYRLRRRATRRREWPLPWAPHQARPSVLAPELETSGQTAQMAAAVNVN